MRLAALAAVALAASAPPSSSAPPTSPAPPPSSEPKPIPAGYEALIDETNTIVVAVPETWTEVDTVSGVNEDGSLRPYIAASPDLDSFLESFDTPGVLYAAFPPTPDPVPLLEEYGARGGCDKLEVKSYEDPVFTGVVQVGTNCGPDGMTWNMVVADHADQTFTAVVQVQTADPEELETVLLTFNRASS